MRTIWERVVSTMDNYARQSTRNDDHIYLHPIIFRELLDTQPDYRPLTTDGRMKLLGLFVHLTEDIKQDEIVFWSPMKALNVRVQIAS